MVTTGRSRGASGIRREKRTGHSYAEDERPKSHGSALATVLSRQPNKDRGGEAAAARSNGTERRCEQGARQQSNPESPRPEPTERLRNRVVVDAEVLRDPADGGAARVHDGSVDRDRLVNRRLKRLDELSLNRKLRNGAKPLRTRPPLLEVQGVPIHSGNNTPATHQIRGENR